MAEGIGDRLVTFSARTKYDAAMMPDTGTIRAHLNAFGKYEQIHTGGVFSLITQANDKPVVVTNLRNPLGMTGAVFLGDSNVIVFNSNQGQLPRDVEDAVSGGTVLGCIVGGQKSALQESSLYHVPNVVYIEPPMAQATKLGVSKVFTLIVQMLDPRKGGKVFYGYNDMEDVRAVFGK